MFLRAAAAAGQTRLPAHLAGIVASQAAHTGRDAPVTALEEVLRALIDAEIGARDTSNAASYSRGGRASRRPYERCGRRSAGSSASEWMTWSALDSAAVR